MKPHIHRNNRYSNVWFLRYILIFWHISSVIDYYMVINYDVFGFRFDRLTGNRLSNQ